MKYLTFLTLIFLVSSNYYQINIQPKLFSPHKLREDLNFLIDNLEEIHPNIYSYTSKIKIDSLKKILIQELNRPMTSQALALIK